MALAFTFMSAAILLGLTLMGSMIVKDIRSAALPRPLGYGLLGMLALLACALIALLGEALSQ